MSTNKTIIDPWLKESGKREVILSEAKLDCDKTKITNLEPLRELHNLKKLDCSHTKITDLEPIRKLHNLTKLDCDKTKITDARNRGDIEMTCPQVIQLYLKSNQELL